MEQRLTDLENAIHTRFNALEAKIMTSKWAIIAGFASFVVGLVLGHLAR